MSQFPATPNKPAEEAAKRFPKTAVPSLEKLASASRAKQASLYEPSPASTHGDTAAGDSVPATPIETHGHGKQDSLFSGYWLGSHLRLGL